MKTDQIPDIYLEQYVLGELPENLRMEIDNLIQHDPDLNKRISEILNSNRNILAAYPAAYMTGKILERKNSTVSSHNMHFTEEKDTQIKAGILAELKNFLKHFSSTPVRRFVLSLSSAVAFILLAVLMFPGIRSGFKAGTDSNEGIRIKGLESKLILYRMKGRNIEELKSDDTARKGDIIQLGYIATGAYRYGVILSIDGRGTVTLHYPDRDLNGTELSLNRKTLLGRAYELDDSPYFERFIMILSSKPINTAGIIERTKKIAKTRDTSITGSVKPGKYDAEFSVIIKKTE